MEPSQAELAAEARTILAMYAIVQKKSEYIIYWPWETHVDLVFGDPGVKALFSAFPHNKYKKNLEEWFAS